MLKRTLSSLLLCVAFGALACSESQDGYFGDTENVTTTAQAENVMKPDPAESKDAAKAESEEGLADPVSDDPTPPPEPVPEPMTMLLFGSGLAGVAYRYRRKRGEEDVEVEEASQPA